MVQPVVHNSLRKLAASEGIKFCLLSTKKGEVKSKAGDIGDTPVHEYCTLSATIFGAAAKANEMNQDKFPNKITVDSSGAYTLLRTIDKDNFLILKTEDSVELEKISEKIENIRWSIIQGL